MNPNGNPATLTPVKPGEVLNPKGINQYTYRANFEQSIDRLLAGRWTFRREPVEDKEGEKVACLICGFRNCNLYVGQQQYAHAACIDEIDGMTRGEAIAYATVHRAMAGDEKMLPHVLDRVWPKVTKHEVDLPGADAAALTDRLSSHATRKRSNGADRSDDDSREAGA